MWEPDTLRAGSAGPGRSEDGMSGKKKSGSARAVPRAYGRLTRHERDTVQRMLERRASCREIARELGRSHVNSEPRGALGFATPARAFRAMLGEDAAALLDAYGVEDVPLGDLDLTPGLIERARAERGDAPLA